MLKRLHCYVEAQVLIIQCKFKKHTQRKERTRSTSHTRIIEKIEELEQMLGKKEINMN